MSLLGGSQAENVLQTGFDATQYASSISAAIMRLADLNLDGMRKKASETDPQKRTYGPAMSAKVIHILPLTCLLSQPEEVCAGSSSSC